MNDYILRTFTDILFVSFHCETINLKGRCPAALPPIDNAHAIPQFNGFPTVKVAPAIFYFYFILLLISELLLVFAAFSVDYSAHIKCNRDFQPLLQLNSHKFKHIRAGT